METIIITDSCSDLPIDYVENGNIHAIGLTCHFKGKEYVDDLGKTLSYKEFYEGVRGGEMPTTSQINVHTFAEAFKKFVNEGKSIIYIGVSSALSGTVSSATIAMGQVLEEYADADISVVDSKSASLGEGLLVYYAYEMLKKGSSKSEIVEWLESNKLKLNHWFTVEDLHHLKRGGRISAATAVIGTLLDIKPIMNVNDEGKLTPVNKVKGRKKALKTLADMFKERAVNPEEQVIAISHGDCIEDVRYLEKLIKDEFKVKDVIINNVGPVIGSHSGPGTVALFFIGENR
jgi:DegV family protein with EDD domain